MNLENYKPYANSEADAQEIVRQMDADNFEGSASYKELAHAPGLWSISVTNGWACTKRGGRVSVPREERENK